MCHKWNTESHRRRIVRSALAVFQTIPTRDSCVLMNAAGAEDSTLACVCHKADEKAMLELELQTAHQEFVVTFSAGLQLAQLTTQFAKVI